MKTHILFLLLLTFGSGALLAQDDASLTIFSEDGYKFWLVLDGNRINQEPKARVTVEGLKKAFYRSKVIFENEDIEAMDKNIGVRDVETNQAMAVTYMIRKTNKGKWVMRVSSFSEIQGNSESQTLTYDDASGKVVEAKTDTQKVSSSVGTGSTTTTTTTTTTQTGSTVNDISIKADMGGMGSFSMKTSVPDMGMEMESSMTVTETSTQSGSMETMEEQASNPAPSRSVTQGCSSAMPAGDFNSAKASVEKQSFSEDQMKVAKQILRSNCLNTGQVIEMMGIFTYEENKLEFAKAAYAKTVDKGNYYKINDAFTYSSSVDELNEFLESQE